MSITVDPGFTDPIAYFEIDWGDGSPLEIIPGAGPLANILHDYDFTGFYNTCDYQEQRFVVLYTYVVGGNPSEPLNSSLAVFFRNPPIANFTVNSSVICLGSQVTLNNASCPTQNLMISPWDYGDGNSGMDNTYTYLNSGSYTISLDVSNACGAATATQTVEVVELPVAGATATSGITGSASADTLLVCLNDSATVQLSSGTSQFETGYTWTVISNNSGNVTWNPGPALPPFNQSLAPNPTLTFFAPGVYVVRLTVGSPCNVTDMDQLIFNVVTAPTASLNLDLTDCEPITINPASLLNISGNLSNCSWDFGTFGTSNDCDPGAITFSASTTIIFQGFNECGTIQDTGFFNLIAVEQALIDSPCADTLCTYDLPCTLSANVAGGNWTLNGQAAGATFNPATAATGLNTITYGASPCILPDQVEIFVIDAGVNINGPTQLCIDGGMVTYTANPSGGTFSSAQNAIDPVTGVYDPLLAGPGPDTIFYELAGNSFCPASASLAIEVVELSVGLEVSSCNGLTICYTTTPGTSVFNSISWNFGNGQTSSQAQPCHTYSIADTYEVSVTITFGVCQVSASDFFTIEEPPNAAFALNYATPSCGPLPVMINNQSTGDNLVYEWSYEGQTSNDPNLSQVTINSPTTVALTISNGCGSSTYSEFVDIEPTPVAGFGVNAYVCSGEPLEIFDVAILYNDILWDFGNGQTSTTQGTQTQTYFTGLENDTVYITQIVTNDCGPDTLTLPVIVVPTDAAANVTTTAAPLFQVCQYEEVCFQSFSQPSGIPLTWDFGDGQTAIALDVCHVWDTPGVYEVIARLVSCGFDSTVIVVTVLPAPLAGFTAPPIACPNNVVSFTNTSTGGTGSMWDFDDGSSSIQTSPTHTFSNPGMYEVCLEIDSANGCTASQCQDIVIAEPPVPDFTISNPGCQGDLVDFGNTSTTNIVACAWNFGDGNLSAACNPQHAYLQSGTFPVTLTVTNNNGCVATLAQNILVGELPMPSFSVQLLNPCHPVTAQFTNSSQLADGYSWDFGDGNTSALTNPQHVYQQPGTYTVTLTAVKDGLCSDVFTQSVTIHETPVAQIDLVQTSVCAGNEFAFGNGSSGTISDYEWSFGDGFFSFDQNPQHTYAQPGSYEVVLVVQNAPHCQDSDTLQVTVHPPVLASATPQHIACYGDATGSIQVLTSSGLAPFQFAWSNGISTPNQSALPAGNYALNITDSNGCLWDTTLTLLQPEPLSLATTNFEIVTCFGGSDGSLCVQASGGVAPYQYQWAGGISGNCLNGIPSGSYDVLVTDANNCEHPEEVILGQNAQIAFTDSLRNRPCFGENVAFIQISNVSGGIGGYSISLENVHGYYEEGSSFTQLQPGTYLLTIMDALGCIAEKQYQITQPDSIWLNIHPDTLVVELGDERAFNTAHNLWLPEFSWSPNDFLSCTDCPDPLVLPLRNMVYRLDASDANGCRVHDEVQVLVDVVRTVYIPNTFTPNSDGRNDRFRVRTGVKSIRSVRAFRVYDRWGELVFESLNFDPLTERPEDGWDGSFRGRRLAPDVYLYYAEIEYIDDEVVIEKGEVLLIR